MGNTSATKRNPCWTQTTLLVSNNCDHRCHRHLHQRHQVSIHQFNLNVVIISLNKILASDISWSPSHTVMDAQTLHHRGDLQCPPELFPVLPDTRPASCIFAHLDSVISSSNTLSTFLMCMFYLKKLLFHDSFSVCLLSILHIITTCKIWAF